MFPILPAGSPVAADTDLPAFLVAHDGLYLRKRSLLGVSQTKVAGVEHLPAETEYVEYGLPKIPADQMARVVGFFRSIYRAQRTEALVLLLWAGESFDLYVPDQKVSLASVSHTLDDGQAAGRIPRRRVDPLSRCLQRRGECRRRRRRGGVRRAAHRRRALRSASVLLGGDCRRRTPLRGPGDCRPGTAPTARRAAGGVVSASQAPATATAVEGEKSPTRVGGRHGPAPGSRCVPSQPRRSRRRAGSGGPPGRRAWAPAHRLARPDQRVGSEGR